MQPEKVLQAFLSDLIEPAPDSAADAHVPRAEPAVDGKSSPTPRPSPQSVLPAVEATPVEPATARPSEDTRPFQVLRFKLRGIELAIPLSALDSIVRWDRRTTVLPGQPHWQRGVALHQEHLVRLVDLAVVIMPERTTPGFSEVDSERYLLIVGGGRFGLICDRIMRPQMLSAEDVRWSGRYRYRPWAKGVLKKELSVLLDVDALLREMGMEDA
jgi:purine-binding chemotaxis protein CheW